MNRTHTPNPDASGSYQESKAPFDAGKKQAHLTILIDKTTVEVFVDGGKVVHSNLVFPQSQDQGIGLFAEGGSAEFDNIYITKMGNSP